MARLSPEEGFQVLGDRVKETLTGLFPIVGKKHTLSLDQVEVKDNLDLDDIRSQKEARLSGRSWAVPVEGRVALVDNATGRAVDSQKIRLLSLPKHTRRYTHIVNGREKQIDNQWRLKSGVYARIKENGELQSDFNLRKGGRGFDIEFDPKTHQFKLAYGTSNIPLSPLMQELGVPRDTIEQQWGKEITSANHADRDQAVAKFYRASVGKPPESLEQARAHLRDSFQKMEVRPDTTRITLGKEHTQVTGHTLMDAATKLLHVSQGKAQPDARDALMFKELHSVEDFMAERLRKGSRDIFRRIQNTLDKKTSVRDIVGPNIFHGPIETMYRTSLVNEPKQINPLEMISGQMKTTITGEGGIQNVYGITDDAKLVDASHLGFLDPIHTPEGEATGVNLRLPLGVKKVGHDVVVRMFNVRTGKMEQINPEKAMNATVALPDQVKWVGGKPHPLGKDVQVSGPGNEIKTAPFKSVDYVMRDPSQMFSVSSNLIPFLPADHPNRSTMAGRHMEQAISLVHREPPLVRSAIVGGKKIIDEWVGKFAGHSSHVDGTVTKVQNDAIHVKDKDGKKHEIQIYDHFPLNDDKSFLHSTPLVKVGDRVKKGQPIADSNFTRGGTLALGTNLKVGYLPYKGYNFEDGVVISESAAKQLTSEHLHQKSLALDKEHVLDKAKYQAYMPGRLNRDQMAKMDDDGVVKPGQLVMPGDPLVLALKKHSDRGEDRDLARLHRSLVKPYRDDSIIWEQDHPGVVQEVVKHGKQILVHVKTQEQAEIGDKVAGRHGNKGIITCHDQWTEVLTGRGWLKFEELRKDDLVCTLNPETDEIEYHRPTATISQQHQGKMFLFDGPRVNLCTTPEHRHWIRPIRGGAYHFETSKEVHAHGTVHKRGGSIWGGTAKRRITIPGRPAFRKGWHEYDSPRSYNADDFLEFFGYWITEGCLSRSSVVIGQSLNANPDTYAAIRACLERLGYRVSAGSTSLAIGDPRLAYWLRQFGLSKNKSIPRTFMSLTKHQLAILMDAMMAGDGCIYYDARHNHTRHEFCTSSKRLADDVQELALKLGHSANIKVNIRKKTGAHEYVVRFSFKDEVFVNNDKRVNCSRWIDYAGPVYCVDVPNHIVYVRRNGVPVWSGNCIIPDHEMPKTADGPLHILLNPAGVPGRTNLGQVLETAVSKVALKTGKPYLVQNFAPNADFHTQVSQELKKHGLTDKEEVFDGVSGKKLGEALVGVQHILKLQHQVEKKLSARAGGPGYAYDRNLIPRGGGAHGAQSLGALGLYAMLAHGAKANLREMQTVKSDSEQSDEFWAALQAGEPLPAPRPTFAYKKFLGYMTGLGLNVKKEGNNLQLIPFTDKQVEQMSNGALPDAAKMVHAKNLKPEVGGSFDPHLTGGESGTKWTHIRLPESFPNPVFEHPIQALLGITHKDFEAVIAGQKGLHPTTGKLVESHLGLTGGHAFDQALGRIDVQKELRTATTQLANPGLKGNRLDQINKKIKFLKALDSAGLSPREAYMQQNIPVMPPVFRPVSQLPNGDLNVDDVNHMYKGIALSASRLKVMSPLLPPEEKNEVRAEVYDGLRSLAGLGGHMNRKFRGILDIISGHRPDKETGEKVGAPKYGYFQDRLVKRKQDLSMRSTIIPEPSLGLDEVGIPRKAAVELYKPFIVRELRTLAGMTPLEAQQHIKDNAPIVDRALERVITDRPILLKRDPVLHKYGVQAFKPRIVGGKAVQIHPLVTSGYNADFDGDAMSAFVPVGNEAVAEAHKMFPSNNLFSPATGSIAYAPTHEALLGLYGVTRTGGKTNKTFKNVEEVEAALRKSELQLNDQIKVGGLASTAGRFLVGGALPEPMRRPFLTKTEPLDKKAQQELLTHLATNHPHDYGPVVDKLKNLGNRWSTDTAFSIGLEDIKPEKEARDKILAAAHKAAAGTTGTQHERDRKAIDIYSQATEQMHKELGKLDEQHSSLITMSRAGIKPTMDTLRQIKMAPMLFMNAKREVIPSPVTKSFAEGLDLAGYWTSMSGARKGIIQKVQAVQEPGYVTKMIMNSVMDNLIMDHDCGTDKGIALHIDEKDILDRHLAIDHKAGKHVFKAGTLVTPEVRTALRNNKVGRVVVRSPLRCQHGPGVCQKCFGLAENGRHPEIGTNIGVMAGQAIGERATQLAMKSFHTGGTAATFTGLVDEFSRVKNLLTFPLTLPNSATLSSVSGRVEKVEKDPAGGHNVFIGGTRHYVPQSRGIPQFDGKSLRSGVEIKKGSPISAGPVNPHEMLPLTGIEAVQGHLSDELHKLYASEGIRRRNHEVVVKAMTSVTKIEDPGSHHGFIRGDFAPAALVANLNRTAPKTAKPIIHKPVLRGVNILPLDLHEDWMARLNHERQTQTVLEAAQKGWISKIHGTHPIPAIVHGAEVGRGDKPWLY